MTDQVPPEETAAPPEEEEEEKKKASPIALIGMAVVGVTLVLVAGLAVLGGLAPGALAILRDITIVMLAILIFLSLLITVFILAIIAYGIHRLGERLDALLERGTQVLEEAKGTAATVKGTAGFVGERIASPFIGISSWVSGIAKGLTTFLRGEKQSGGSHE